MRSNKLGVFHIAIKSGSGAEVFTHHLHKKLLERGIASEIFWLPHYAEFMPWLVKKPVVPKWASVIHVNTRTHPRFLSHDTSIISTFHSSIYDSALLKYKTYIQYLYQVLWIKMCEQKTVSYSDKVTAVSRFTEKEVKHVFNLSSIEIIYNSVDTDFFCPNKSNRNKKSVVDILFVGKPTLLKGIDILLSVAERLSEGYRLNITASLKDFNHSIVLPKNVNLLGKITGASDLVKIYQDTDIFLFPSRLEGLSLALLEAQSCSIPCVVSNSSSMPEVIKNGVNGFLCDLNSVDDFVVAICKLGENSELREEMGRQARKNVLESFSENMMIDKYISLYSSIAERK